MVHTATCPLCEASCGLQVDTDGAHIRSIRGDTDDPFSRGYLCPKAAALADLQDDPDRIRAPLVREGSRWREVSWDEAWERAADGLVRVRKAGGRDAVAVYYGNPVAHNLGLMTHALPFGRALRTKNVYSASSADQLPQMLAAFRMFGHLALIPVPDLDRADYFLIVGANPPVSNGSLMTVPNMTGRLRAIRDRGGRVVVIDPRECWSRRRIGGSALHALERLPYERSIHSGRRRTSGHSVRAATCCCDQDTMRTRRANCG